jgi:HK97 family phage major capsid protein
MISDAAFDVEQEINNQITREFAKREGAAFIKGDGVGKPQGIVTNTDIQEVNSGVSNDITADSLIEIAGELKDGYNPAYMLNRRTLARIRTLKGGDGHYLWQPGLGQGIPNTINGLPYFSAIDLDDVAAGNIPVLLGDFGEGYNIVDSDQMSMLRDPYSSASTGKVRFIARRRVGGQVVLPEAIKKLKIAT